ncbi:P-loop containing nucleoside triphosphate hydrolase protein [Amylocystis lapponica]|nr:P-loop containing nucleoside triphosphate hydrolase protein [Amylocystis lapponica]
MPVVRDADVKKRYDRTKKFVHSAPIPLEPDSDPDFNPGEYVSESPKQGGKTKGKGKASSSQGPARKRGRRKRSAEDDYTDNNERPRKTTRTEKALGSQNPLVEFFGELGLQSASEDEAEADDEEGEFDDDDDASHHSEEEDAPPQVLKTIAALVKKPPPGSQAGTSGTPEEESVTEPETDQEDLGASNALKRKPSDALEKSRPQKKVKLADPNESVTEQSDEDSPSIPSTISARKPRTQVTGNTGKNDAAEESVTESETEPETDQDIDTTNLEARPAFALKRSQPILSSLVLDVDHKVPARINAFLREYQRDGIRFFWERYKNGRGGLLGDDMGLTIQVIAFLSAIMRKHGDTRDLNRRRQHVSDLQDKSPEWRTQRVLPPANKTWPTCLIIAPSSVVGNWEREFETWGYFEVGLYIGVPQQRADVLRDFKMGRLDVVLTSFDVARRDISLLDDLAWSCVIVDEVHRVKNPRSKLTAAFGQFECPIRFGLTGTAIQNSYLELWTILNWTNPGAVGTRGQWEGYVVRPLTVGQSKSASDEEHMKAALVAKILKEKLLPKFFLRRTKYIIKDQLPKKIDEVVFCPLTPMQLAVYKRIVGMDAVQNMIRKDEACDCGSRKTRKKCCHPFEKGDLFKYMSTLIKISNHLALILPSPTDTPDQTARNRELSQVAFGKDHVPKYGQAVLSTKFCGKWLVLETLLEEWRKDRSNKVLIFTKSVRLLQMLDFHLQNQNLGFVRLDGSTKQSDRMPLIDRFHQDPNIVVFLISTLAGGTGLNLTGANKVVIFDPAHDLQAMDRAYRFGQTRDVSVYRLLGAGSIEELIYARQIYKQQQMLVGYNASLQTRYFEGVQGEKGKQGELFGIKNIFKLHEDTLATKMAIERATLSDFDWALTHMDAKVKKASSSQKDEKWVYEAEARGDLRGLGSLLFDDDPPEVNDKNTDIQKTLNDVGINYTHRNEDLIAESAVEVQRMRILMEEKKQAAKKAKAQRKNPAASKEPEKEWPPRRRHHKPAPTPKEKLLDRRVALVELGFIRTVGEVPVFAQQFLQKPLEEQNEILAKLDEHAKQNRT